MVEDYLQSCTEGDDDLINAPGASDRRPLHRAAGSNQVKICEYLLSKGALVDVTDNAGRTPLHWSVINGHEDVVTVLLNQGRADLTIKTKESGTTALHLCAENGKVSIARMLLLSCKEGDPSTQTLRLKDFLGDKCAKGKTALDYAKEKHHSAVVKLIHEVEKGLRKNTSDGGDSSVCRIS
jgi:ankyrin repeat protein